MSQDQAAAEVGVSREMWGKYERDVALPGGDVLAALARAGADVNYLLIGVSASRTAVNEAASGTVKKAGKKAA